MLLCFSLPLSVSSFLRIFPVLLVLVCILQLNGASTTPTKIGKGYRLISIEESPNGGIVGHLQVKQKNNIYGPDIPLLQLYVKHETENRLRVHITDAEKQRWEVPYNLLPRETPPSSKQSIGLPRSNTVTLMASEENKGRYNNINDIKDLLIKSLGVKEPYWLLYMMTPKAYG